jgi:hypothetical protein
VHQEADRRGYHFDAERIGRCARGLTIKVTRGQLDYEWAHLRAKLKLRDPAALQRIISINESDSHPLFEVVAGDIEPWEVLR